MNKRTGRPPPQWVYDLYDFDLKKDSYTKKELSSLLGVSTRAIEDKFKRLGIESDYDKVNGSVVSLYQVLSMRSEIGKHIREWDNPDF